MPAYAGKEKITTLRALGAEVIVCPNHVPADDPQSYYSQAERLAEETPNSFYVNQYYNDANLDAHYRSTGPELWNQTGGLIIHFIATCRDLHSFPTRRSSD